MLYTKGRWAGACAAVLACTLAHAAENTQTLQFTHEFNGSLPEATVEARVVSDWDVLTCVAPPFCQKAGKTGLAFGIESDGFIGLDVTASRSAVSVTTKVPLAITLELPDDGVVAPEEKFTISTNWSTPARDALGRNNASFTTSAPTSFDARLDLTANLDSALDVSGCLLGECKTGRLELPPLVRGAASFVDLSLSLLNLKLDQGQNVAKFVGNAANQVSGVGLLADPHPIDVLRIIDGGLAGVSSINVGTDYSDIAAVTATATQGTPKGQSLSKHWQENLFGVNLDVTNIITAAIGKATNLPAPPFNGTMGDLVEIALSKTDPLKLSKPQKVAKFLLGSLLDTIKYNLLEVEIEASTDVMNQFRLTPRAPELRIMNGTDALSGWFNAGEDVTIEMPTGTDNVTVDVRTAPTFTSDFKIIGNPVVQVSAFELQISPLLPKLGPAFSTGDLVPTGDTVLGSTLQTANFTPAESTGAVDLPDALATPRVTISGGGGLAFGRKRCWEPDNLPPGTPSGISFDDDDGCTVSFRDLTANGEVSLESHGGESSRSIALTLLNSTLSGQGGALAEVVLNPNAGTSVQLTGETRQSGFDQVDFLFDDERSSGNRNQIIIDTENGAFIRNSRIRGSIGNENQSDIVLRDGRLWIDNTEMELDNLTIESSGGTITMQDSTARLRNLQVGGEAGSVLRLTRDSLITTASNRSYNTTGLEIGSGSLVNISGNFSNTGVIDIELGGWLTVLRGNDPLLADRLTGPGEINIAGLGNPADAYAALARVPDPMTDPVAFFEDRVRGTRSGTGTLLLANGTIEDSTINNVGGTLLALGGTMTDTTVNMADNATFLVAREPLVFSQSSVSGTGNLDIAANGSLILDQSVIGDQLNAPHSLRILNQGYVSVLDRGGDAADNRAAIVGNATLVNQGTVEVGVDTTLGVSRYLQTDGTTIVDGVVIAEQALGLKGGALRGSGSVVGSVVNGSGVLVADGLDITGAYTQLSGGTLELDFSLSATPFLSVGVADLTGTLSVVLTDGLLDALAVGDMYDFLGYDLLLGGFTNFELSLTGGRPVRDYAFDVLYGATHASLVWLDAPALPTITALPPDDPEDTPVPAPATLVLLSVWLGFMLFTRRRRHSASA